MNILISYFNRKATYYKNYYYRNNFFIYNFKENYLQIKSNELFNTETPILFKGKVKLGSTLSEINSILGKSHFQIEAEKIINYLTTYYKNKISSLKNKSQLHFYNQRFFFGVQFFPYLSSLEKDNLLNIIKIKYQIPLSLTLPLFIKDKDDNILVIRENVGIILEYFSGEKLLINSVLKAFEEEEQQLLIKQKKAFKIIMNNV